MTCPRCQTANPPENAACEACGFVLYRGDRGAGAITGESPKRGLAITSLVLGILGLPTLGLLGVGAILGIILGVVALVKANKEPAVYGGKGLAIAGIVTSAVSFIMIPFIGIIAAIAIPSLLRARASANESGAIGDIRTVISAEVAYQSTSGGSFDTLECLAGPTRCLPQYPASAPTFVGPEMLVSPRHGYSFTFHPGAPAARPGQPGSSPSSVSSFAYVAVPVAWNRTGTRAFCGDSTGQLCYARGRAPGVVDGLCADPCEPLS